MKQYLGGHKFKDERKGEAVVIRGLVPRDTDLLSTGTKDDRPMISLPQLWRGLCGK